MRFFNPFHQHSFDPEKWELIQRVSVHGDAWSLETKLPTKITTKITDIYRNTCLECGDLVFRRIEL